MKPLHIATAIAALALAGAAFAQAPAADSSSRGSSDGTRPGDGAIKGGSIVPGENGGLPKTAPSGEAAERDKRCNELSGTLRDDCLLKEQSSNAGSNRAPDSGGAKTAPLRDAPPPQNPR
jgi:hypothetical protein